MAAQLGFAGATDNVAIKAAMTKPEILAAIVAQLDPHLREAHAAFQRGSWTQVWHEMKYIKFYMDKLSSQSSDAPANAAISNQARQLLSRAIIQGKDREAAERRFERYTPKEVATPAELVWEAYRLLRNARWQDGAVKSASKARDAETVIRQLVRALYAAQDYYANGNVKLGHNALVGALNACRVLGNNGILQSSEFRTDIHRLNNMWTTISRLIKDAATVDEPEDNAYIVRETRRIMYDLLPTRWRVMVD